MSNVRAHMEIKLSTSDFIAVAMGLVQVLVSIAIGIWTVRQTTQQRPAEHYKRKNARQHIVAWLRSSWLFLVFFAYGAYEVWSLATSGEVLSKVYVFKLVYLSFYTAFNVIAAIGFFVFELQMTINMGVLDVLQRSNEAQGCSLELQRQSLEATKQVFGSRTSRSKRRR